VRRCSAGPTSAARPTDRVINAVFAPDGEHILTASADNTARLWDADGKELATFKGHTNALHSAVFAPDGHRILTAGDTTARLWDTDGKELAIFNGHSTWVNSAVFSPDGRRILTSSDDTTARLWDADGTEVATLKGHTSPVYSAVFAPDGRSILTASEDNTARLWEAFPNSQELIDRAKTELPRCLTLEQRRTLFLTPTPPSWCLQKWPYNAVSPATAGGASK
jgi:WD40 repeat protein